MPFINSLMGTASAGGAEKPDLLITTQTLWDALWTRVQPQQRKLRRRLRGKRLQHIAGNKAETLHRIGCACEVGLNGRM